MSLRVLVVDDALFMRAALAKAIADQGWSVVGEADNGEEAIERYQELRPDIVTLDITMPIMDGLSALKAIMRLDAQARVIMCSAVGLQRNIDAAMQAGAKIFLQKPFRDADVVNAIATAMDPSKAH